LHLNNNQWVCEELKTDAFQKLLLFITKLIVQPCYREVSIHCTRSTISLNFLPPPNIHSIST